MELTFDGEGCHMELVEVSNCYRRYQEVIDTVTEYSMPGEVIFDSEKWEYNFRFEKDDVVVSFFTDLNHANANINITYAGKECEQDWMFLSVYSECYFELYDQDNDGKQELIYHQIKYDEETIQVYEFQ